MSQANHKDLHPCHGLHFSFRHSLFLPNQHDSFQDGPNLSFMPSLVPDAPDVPETITPLSSLLPRFP
jgi:hypothetical protein